MASYEKIVKHIIEKFQQSLSPLGEIIKNQEIIIIQNRKLHEMLENIYSSRLAKTKDEEADYCIDLGNIAEADDSENK